MRATVRLFLTCSVLLALCPTIASPRQASTDSIYSLEEQARKAYDSKDYAKSTQLFDAAFAAGLNRAEDAYNAACSAALAGNPAKALRYLERAARLGFRDPAQMKADTDLESIRSDPRFQALIERAHRNELAYERDHSDPNRAAIVTSDVNLFWATYDAVQRSSNPEMLIEKDYFLRGSPGLQDFIFARIYSARDLCSVINRMPKYYATLRPATLHIKDFTPRIRASFRRMKELYPDSTFPDVYFLIGRLNSAGTTGPSGLLLGADMFGKGPQVPLDELDEWHRAVIQPVDSIPGVVAHELIHYQQRMEGKTLLAAALREGSADFIGELISGENMNQTARNYGFEHEPELWMQFTLDMHGTDTSHWMYEGKVVNGRPADLAYFIGYRISQAYYEKAADKKKAIAEILNSKDADQLLNDSGYAKRFTKQ
jgi:hypothetical protein